MKVGEFRLAKSLMINWGGFAASLYNIVETSFGKLVHSMTFRSGLLIGNCYL